MANQYFAYYNKQVGGGDYQVYRGFPHQYGNGLGDILRSIGRFLLPIVAPIASRAASSFIQGTSSGLKAGQSLKDAAKSSIGPTLRDTISTAGDVIGQRVTRSQGGSGRRRRRPKTRKAATHKSVKRAYKRKASSSRKSIKNKKFRGIPINSHF